MSEAYQAKKCGDEHHYVNQCQCRVEKLEAENARFREALELIAEGPAEGWIEIAKQALEGREK